MDNCACGCHHYPYRGARPACACCASGGSAHSPASEEAQDAEDAAQTRKLYETQGVGAFKEFTNWPPPASEPPDRLGEIAREVASQVLATYHAETLAMRHARYAAAVRAALERVVLESADVSGSEIGWMRSEVLEHWGLK